MAVLLVVVILLGLVAPNKNWVTYAFFAIGAIILILVLNNTASAFGYFGNFGFYFQQYLPWIIILAAIGIVVGVNSKPPESPVQSMLTRALGKD